MTPKELEALIARKLFPKNRAELTWAEIVGVVQAATAEQKNALVGLFANGKGDQAGRALQVAIDKQMRTDAEAEAAAMMADNSLSEAELLRLLG